MKASPGRADERTKVPRRWAQLAQPPRLLLIALLLAAGMIGYDLGFLIPQARYARVLRHVDQGDMFGGDFYPLWLTCRELRDNRQNPYAEFTTFAIQRHLYGRTLGQGGPDDLPLHYRAFSYPLFADLMFWPLAELKFEPTRSVLAAVFPILVALTAVLWMRTLGLALPLPATVGAVLLYGTSYGGLEAFYALQPTIVVAALLAAATAALVARRYWLAGTWLALAGIKPQLVVIVTVWLLLWSVSQWRLRRGLVLSFALIATILLLASELIVPGWITLWVKSLAEYRTYTLPPLFPFVMGRLGDILGIVLVAVMACLGWRFRHLDVGDQFLLFVSFLLAATVAVIPTAGAMYEDLLLWPGLVWIYSHRQEFLTAKGPRKWILYVGIAAFLWSFVAACGLLVWMAFGLPLDAPTLLAPIRLTASLPFIVIGLLALALLRRVRSSWQTTESVQTS